MSMDFPYFISQILLPKSDLKIFENTYLIPVHAMVIVK